MDANRLAQRSSGTARNGRLAALEARIVALDRIIDLPL
jgi:hypothetical protein